MSQGGPANSLSEQEFRKRQRPAAALEASPARPALAGDPRERLAFGQSSLAAHADALERATGTGRAGLAHSLQRQRGNAYTQRVVHLVLQRRLDGATVRREDGDDAQPLDTAAASSTTETVGPPAESSYAVTASTLDDVSSALEAMPEAAKVEWIPKKDYNFEGTKVTQVTVDVKITLEMPAWTPPATMGPKSKAEWTRFRAALRAHEDGHVKLVHDHFDGIAKKMLGKTPKQADTLFTNATAALDTASKAYDTTTDHGKKTGTIIDVSIEEKELEEAKPKAAEAP